MKIRQCHKGAPGNERLPFTQPSVNETVFPEEIATQEFVGSVITTRVPVITQLSL